MAWTVITDATLEVGKALRALTMRNLRDNIAAVANGDTGAPKVQTLAIQDLAVTTAKIAASAVTTAKIADSNVTTGKIATGAVAAWNASLATGEIGTYAYLYGNGFNIPFTAGSNYSGLVYSGVRVDQAGGTSAVIGIGAAAGGTWKAMGTISGAASRASTTLFLRIA